MNRKDKNWVFVLILLLGFCVGMVVGYITIGFVTEQSCQKALTSYSEYIGRYCPTPQKLQPMYKELLPNGSLGDKVYFEEDLNQWINQTLN